MVDFVGEKYFSNKKVFDAYSKIFRISMRSLIYDESFRRLLNT